MYMDLKKIQENYEGRSSQTKDAISLLGEEAFWFDISCIEIAIQRAIADLQKSALWVFWGHKKPIPLSISKKL